MNMNNINANALCPPHILRSDFVIHAPSGHHLMKYDMKYDRWIIYVIDHSLLQTYLYDDHVTRAVIQRTFLKVTVIPSRWKCAA